MQPRSQNNLKNTVVQPRSLAPTQTQFWHHSNLTPTFFTSDNSLTTPSAKEHKEFQWWILLLAISIPTLSVGLFVCICLIWYVVCFVWCTLFWTGILSGHPKIYLVYVCSSAANTGDNKRPFWSKKTTHKKHKGPEDDSVQKTAACPTAHRKKSEMESCATSSEQHGSDTNGALVFEIKVKKRPAMIRSSAIDEEWRWYQCCLMIL